MGLAAHQEEIIAQLYREMYRKLVVYADTPQGQRRRSCQQCADYRTHLLEYRSAPAHDLFELQMRANTASRFCFPASHLAPSYSPDSHWSPLERKKGRNLWFLKSPGLADLMFCCLSNSLAHLIPPDMTKAPNRWFRKTNNPALDFLWYLFFWKFQYMFVFRSRSRKTQRLYYLKYGKVPVQVWESRDCHQWKNKKFSGPFVPGKPWGHCVRRNVLYGWQLFLPNIIVGLLYQIRREK